MRGQTQSLSIALERSLTGMQVSQTCDTHTHTVFYGLVLAKGANGELLTTRFWGCSGLVGFDMRPESMLICDVANLPK